MDLYLLMDERMNGRVHRGTIESGQCAFYPCDHKRPKPFGQPLRLQYRVKCWVKQKKTPSGTIMEAERQNQLAARLEDYAERQESLRRYL